MSHVQVLGKCSICGGRVTCPAGPIGYVGPLDDLVSCESCGARRATSGPVIEMEPRRINITPRQRAKLLASDSDAAMWAFVNRGILPPD